MPISFCIRSFFVSFLLGAFPVDNEDMLISSLYLFFFVSFLFIFATPSCDLTICLFSIFHFLLRYSWCPPAVVLLPEVFWYHPSFITLPPLYQPLHTTYPHWLPSLAPFAPTSQRFLPNTIPLWAKSCIRLIDKSYFSLYHLIYILIIYLHGINLVYFNWR